MTTVFTVTTNPTQASETFHHRRAERQARGTGDAHATIRRRRRLCSKLPQAFVKTKEVHAKFEAEDDFRGVARKRGGKKFLSERA